MKIVHISDPHFGFRHLRDGKKGPLEKESTHCFIDKNTGKPRPTDLARMLHRAENCNRPDLVIASGDIGWSGVKDDYRYALRFFQELKKLWPTARFIITAGNHDVNLKAHSDIDRQNDFIEMLGAFYGNDFSRIFPFMRLKNPDTKRDRLVAIDYIKDEVLIVAVNSAATINRLEDPILLRPRVFQLIENHVSRLRVSSKTLKVFVLHHHLLPFAEPRWSSVIDINEVRERPDTSIVANSAKLQSWLAENSFSIVLHGHKHIFHGREDLLWRHGSSYEEKKLLILGAGSAGVTTKELGKDIAHSFNILDIARRSSNVWDVRILTASITDKKLEHGITDWFEHNTLLGSAPQPGPSIFQAEDMNLCHQAIKVKLANKAVTNFISIVENSTYIHPNTTRIGDTQASQKDVERSFVALHPEYDERDGWNDFVKVDKFLHRLNNSYRIQHGPRLFSRLDRADGLRPIRHAIQFLPARNTRAYVGLYNPEKDVVSDWEPLPGLVGLQFIPNDHTGRLDIVATFRNLELSFWWVVNMLEARRLLEWACRRISGKDYKPGRVTFFSSLAEWRADPRPMFVSELDNMREEELFVLLMNANTGNKSTVKILCAKLKEKAATTNDLNIQYRGLEHMLFLVRGIIKQREYKKRFNNRSPISESFRDQLEIAIRYLREAVEDREKRTDKVVSAQDVLGRIVKELCAQGSTISNMKNAKRNNEK
jgi:predicted MPP superfamily phosphohydrolase